MCGVHIRLHWLRRTGYGDALLFMSAAALFVYCADTRPKLKSLNATIFRFIFGSGTRMTASSPVVRSPVSTHDSTLSAPPEFDLSVEEEEDERETPENREKLARARQATFLEEDDDHVSLGRLYPRALQGGSGSSSSAVSSASASTNAAPRVSAAPSAPAAAPAAASAAPSNTQAESASAVRATNDTTPSRPAAGHQPLFVRTAVSLLPSLSEDEKKGADSTAVCCAPAPSSSNSSPPAGTRSLSAAASSPSNAQLSEPSPLHLRRRPSQDINLYSPLTKLPPLPHIAVSRSASATPPVSPLPRKTSAEESKMAMGGALNASDLKKDVFFTLFPRNARSSLFSASPRSAGTSVSDAAAACLVHQCALFELDLYLFLSALGFDCWYDHHQLTGEGVSPSFAKSPNEFAFSALYSFSLPGAALPVTAPSATGSGSPVPACTAPPTGTAATVSSPEISAGDSSSAALKAEPQRAVSSILPQVSPANPLSLSPVAPLFDTLEAALERELAAAAASKIFLCVLNPSSLEPGVAPTSSANVTVTESHSLVPTAETTASVSVEEDFETNPLEGIRRIIRARGLECVFPIFYHHSRAQAAAQAMDWARSALSPSTPPEATRSMSADLAAPLPSLPLARAVSLSSPRDHHASVHATPARRSSSERSLELGELFTACPYGIELPAPRTPTPSDATKGTTPPTPSAAPFDESPDDHFNSSLAVVSRLVEMLGWDAACLQQRRILLPRASEFWRKFFNEVRSGRTSLLSSGRPSRQTLRDVTKRLRSVILSAIGLTSPRRRPSTSSQPGTPVGLENVPKSGSGHSLNAPPTTAGTSAVARRGSKPASSGDVTEEHAAPPSPARNPAVEPSAGPPAAVSEKGKGTVQNLPQHPTPSLLSDRLRIRR